MTALLLARALTVTRHGRRVVGPVTLTVQAGERCHVRGPSGAGKTTLLRALGGLAALAPGVTTRGAVAVAGIDPAAARAPDLARRIGQVFQVAEDQLLALDVASEIASRLENTGVPVQEGHARLAATLARWGLNGLAERSCGHLSAGEAKRVALAAALVTEPDVLLLDEPFTGLDPQARHQLAGDLQALPADVAVVLTDHGDATARGVATRTFALAPAPRALPFRVPGTAPAGPPAIAARDAAFTRGDRVVVRTGDLAVGPGFVALVGLNGAGKSTLLRGLAGLQAPTSGSVTVAGLRDPHAADPRDVAARVGLATHLSLDHFAATSLAAEVATTARAIGVHVETHTALGAVGLDVLAARHPFALSGGERQRLALATAAAHAPRVLLLDEPTVGLDDAGRAALASIIVAVRARGGVAIAATHDEALIAAADRVITLENGHAADAGSPADFARGAGRAWGYRMPVEVAA